MGKLGFFVFWRVVEKGVYFIGAGRWLREMKMRKKGVQSSTPIGYLKKTGGYGFRAVIGRM